MNPTQTKQQASEAALAAKAIAYTENGGKPDLANPSAGKSGELKSIFQFEPETWAADSQEVFGKSGVPLNNDTESYVATQMVQKQLEEGKTLPQIFSSWNAGPGEPDAYTGKFSNGEPSLGRNKEGVSFNVPAYVKTAMNYYNQFSQDNGGDVATDSSVNSSQWQQAPANQKYQNDIATIVNLVKKGQNPSQQTNTGSPSGNQVGVLPSLSGGQIQQKPQVGQLPGLLS